MEVPLYRKLFPGSPEISYTLKLCQHFRDHLIHPLCPILPGLALPSFVLHSNWMMEHSSTIANPHHDSEEKHNGHWETPREHLASYEHTVCLTDDLLNGLWITPIKKKQTYLSPFKLRLPGPKCMWASEATNRQPGFMRPTVDAEAWSSALQSLLPSSHFLSCLFGFCYVALA